MASYEATEAAAAGESAEQGQVSAATSMQDEDALPTAELRTSRQNSLY